MAARVMVMAMRVECQK
jgi:hypothetical protein